MQNAQRRSDETPSTLPWQRAGLVAIRYGIGGVMVLGGLVMFIVDGGEIGAYGFASAAGAGLSVVLLNVLYRVGVSGDREREQEEEARRYFDAHGEWPDDEDAPEPLGGRRWRLPRGLVSAEQEARARRAAPPGRGPDTLSLATRPMKAPPGAQD